jgi:hypothetical protein
MLTVYAISLLTDRTFIIKNELANNCLIQKFLLPNKINWTQEVDDIYNNLTQNSIVFDWPGKIEESKFSQINFLE